MRSSSENLSSKKNSAQPSFDKEVSQMVLKMEAANVKRINAYQYKFGLQWLIVIRCNNLRFRLSNQQLKIAVGFHLGSKIVKNIDAFAETM